MTQLKWLNLNAKLPNPSKIEMLELPNLEVLIVRHLKDDQIPSIHRFPNLRILSMDRSFVSDNGVKMLTEFKDLRVLSLHQCTNVTSDSINHFAQMRKLKLLQLGRTGVMDSYDVKYDCVPELRIKLPECVIDFTN